MAQAVPAASPVPSGGLGLAKLSEKEAFELGQYEKIIQIRDAIISGKHPTITLHRSSNASSDSSIPPRRNVSHSKAPRQRQDNNASASLVSSQPEVTAQPELNPIVLEDSDKLVKAELQIQRQRLERALKDEAEQRFVEKLGYAEPSSELDLSDVLAKALVIVQATAAPAADGEKLNANAESTTDSFDESTFYSSRHDTPESHLVSRMRNSSEDVQATDVHPQHEESSQQPGKQPQPPSGPAADSVKVAHPRPTAERRDLSAAANATLTSHMSIVPGLNNYVQATGITKDPTLTVSGAGSQSDAPTQGDSRTSKSQMPMNNVQVPRDSRYETHPPSPLIRNHNTLQPIAPQPTHPSSVSALAATSSIVHGASHAAGYRSAVATPAQVAALRTEQHVVTSPDSSSQGGKRKDKKKKRKADKQGGIGTESVSFVKQEPRSPSPLNAPSYIRPSKRARHTQDQSAALEFQPRYEPASAHDAGAQFGSRSVRDHAIPIGHSTTAAYHRPYGSAATGEPRYSSGRYYEEQVNASEGPRHHDGRPIDHTTHYLSRPAPASGPVSQVMLAESRPMSSRAYREFQDGSRMMAHPDGETFVAPPRPAPARILVDAYGREYVEPSHPSSRLSVASPSRHGDHEVVYERLPPRAVSRHAVPGSYEDGGVIYTAPPQAYALPRRIVTQPEYTTRDYRDLRPREFSSRPLPAQGEFVQVLAPNERRYGEDVYGARPTSVRPVDSVHYQMPPDYGRVHSVRPELPVAAEYRASVHPDSRHEILQPYLRDYRPAPAQEPAMQRAYSVRPPDPPQSGQLRGVNESTFVERPSGATQEIVYADDGRREYYR